jgi:hypothetical protein
MSSISGVSSTTNPYQIAYQSSLDQFGQDFKAVGSALQSGDLSSAQSALAAFQKDLQGNSQTSTNQPFGKNTQANKDFQSLTSTLQSGDLAAAQKAFAGVQTDLKAAYKGHHHHHSSSSTSATAQTNSAATSSAIGSDGSKLNVAA